MPIHDPTPNLNPDDKQFEAYLRTFRPLDAGPFEIEASGRAIHSWVVLTPWAAVAAAILTTAFLTFHSLQELTHSIESSEKAADEGQIAFPLPQSLGSANALLAQAPSVKAALDQLSFHSPFIRLPKGKKSAIAVLSKDTDQL